MKKIYIKFIANQLGLSVLMFAAWSLFAGIENARRDDICNSSIIECDGW